MAHTHSQFDHTPRSLFETTGHNRAMPPAATVPRQLRARSEVLKLLEEHHLEPHVFATFPVQYTDLIRVVRGLLSRASRGQGLRSPTPQRNQKVLATSRWGGVMVAS